MTELQQLRDTKDMIEIHQRLAESGECLIAPTHGLYRDGELIGAVSVSGMPMIHWWFDRERGQALSSIRGVRSLDVALRNAGIELYQTMVPDRSPFAPLMDRLGYVKAFKDTGTLFLKHIGG